MAFMQETPRSLRAYLVLVGLLGAAGNLYHILSTEAGALERLFALLGLAICLGYTWIGFSFHSLIATSPMRIEQVLIVGAAYSLLLGAIVGVMSPSQQERGTALAEGLGGLLITLYLLRNVRRIAREGQAPGGAA